tara:strand:- start:1880 stop:2683 length:804 start_codon:yes stop_codon:yes gene_type:complete
MSPEQFETLIQRILTNLGDTTTDNVETVQNNSTKDTQINQLNNRVDVLERLLIQLNGKQTNGTSVIDEVKVLEDLKEKQDVDKKNQVILDKIAELNDKINKNKSIVVEPTKTEVKIVKDPNDSNEVVFFDTNENYVKDHLLAYKHSSAMLGFNYGGASTGNLGARLHFDIANTNFEFMPEIYVGVGESSTWAVSGNAVYPVLIDNEKFNPYAGAGVGFGNLIDDATVFYNVIIGTKLPIINENLYIDYTMRNTFKYNQIAIGYNFKF